MLPAYIDELGAVIDGPDQVAHEPVDEPDEGEGAVYQGGNQESKALPNPFITDYASKTYTAKATVYPKINALQPSSGKPEQATGKEDIGLALDKAIAEEIHKLGYTNPEVLLEQLKQAAKQKLQQQKSVDAAFGSKPDKSVEGTGETELELPF